MRWRTLGAHNRLTQRAPEQRQPGRSVLDPGLACCGAIDAEHGRHDAVERVLNLFPREVVFADGQVGGPGVIPSVTPFVIPSVSEGSSVRSLWLVRPRDLSRRSL